MFSQRRRTQSKQLVRMRRDLHHLQQLSHSPGQRHQFMVPHAQNQAFQNAAGNKSGTNGCVGPLSLTSSSNFRTWNPLIDSIGATSDIQSYRKTVAMGYCLSSFLRSQPLCRKKRIICIYIYLIVVATDTVREGTRKEKNCNVLLEVNIFLYCLMT